MRSNFFKGISVAAFSAVLLQFAVNQWFYSRGTNNFLEKSKVIRTKLLQKLWGEKSAVFLSQASTEDRLRDSIFFVEVNDALNQIPAKLMCAFESAALKNPLKPVAVILNQRSRVDLVPSFSNVPNLGFYKVDSDVLLEGMPTEQLWRSGQLHNHTCRRKHFAQISDILRTTLLYKFGGAYLDTDVLSLKRLPGPNFTVFEDQGSINGAILKFSRRHPFMKSYMEQQAASFDPNAYFGIIGPVAQTRAVKDYCQHKIVALSWWQTLINRVLGAEVLFKPALEGVECADFEVMPVKTAYPVHYSRWRDYYDEDEVENVEKMIEESHFVHYWNSMKEDFFGFTKEPERILLRKIQPWYRIAERNCPQTEKFFLRYLTERPF